MIEIRPLQPADPWADLVNRQPLQPFLQTWPWGDFQQAIGRRIWRLGAFAHQQLVGSALVISHELLFGKTYLYCPRGPVADSPAALRALAQAIRDLGRETDAMYVKIDPGLYRFADELREVLNGFQEGTTLQPQQTSVINVEQPPETLLATLHPKTRYNIRLAEKKGVTVRWSGAASDLEVFLRLMHATAGRQGIRLHSDSYYRLLFSTLNKAGMAELILGEYNGAVRAAHLVVWHGQTATYLHGGSDDIHKEAMVPYLLQWQTIVTANQRGVRDYDLWGVAPDDSPTHRWAGITRFKRGFGGRDIAFPSAFNAVLQPQWYQAYRLAKRIRGGVDE